VWTILRVVRAIKRVIVRAIQKSDRERTVRVTDNEGDNTDYIEGDSDGQGEGSVRAIKMVIVSGHWTARGILSI